MSGRRRLGTVRRLPSGRWQARYWSDEGERLGAPTTFPTKADAQRWLSSVETDRSRGEWSDPRLGEAPFEEWTRTWLATKLPQLRLSTADHYEYLLRRNVLPYLGPKPVGRITPIEIQSWLATLYSSKLSPNTVAKAYRLVKMVLADAVDAGLIPRSPCRIKRAGVERHPEMQVATPEQIVAIADAVGPRWEAFVFAAAYPASGGVSSPAFNDSTSTPRHRRSRSFVNWPR